MSSDDVGNNETDAVGQGQMIIDDVVHYRREAVYRGMEGIDGVEDDLLNEEDAAEETVAYVDQWQVVATLVERSPVGTKRIERKVDRCWMVKPSLPRPIIVI